MSKVMLVGSFGGHWVQLLLLSQKIKQSKVYVSTDSFAKEMIDKPFYKITNCSRHLWWRIPLCFIQCLLLLIRVRPKVILTTGAAPGLIMLLLGKIFFCKTIWIDSIANANELSGSGKVASKFAHTVVSQWPDVAERNSLGYIGSVL